MFSNQAAVHSFILMSTHARTLTAGRCSCLLMCPPGVVLTRVEIELVKDVYDSLSSLRWASDGYRHRVVIPYLWAVSAHLCCLWTGSSWWQFSTLHRGEYWFCVKYIDDICLSPGACILKRVLWVSMPSLHSCITKLSLLFEITKLWFQLRCLCFYIWRNIHRQWNQLCSDGVSGVHYISMVLIHGRRFISKKALKFHHEK